MHFVIFGIDRAGVERSDTVMQAHREYLAIAPVKLVVSGPLVSDDEQDTVGSLYLLEAENRAAIDEFLANDPLVAADYWEMVEVRAFNKRVDNR